jgi:hypothetical protein
MRTGRRVLQDTAVLLPEQRLNRGFCNKKWSDVAFPEIPDRLGW